MSNQNNNNQNNNETKNPFESTNLVDGLTTLSISLPQVGAEFLDTCSNIQEKILNDIFIKNLGFKEADRLLIYPVIERDRTVSDIVCYAYFDAASRDAQHVKLKNGANAVNSAKRQTVMDGMVISSSGDDNFDFSNHFTEMIAPLCDLDREGKFKTRSLEVDPSICVVELNFWLVGALFLRISDDDPYNFTVLSVEPTGARRRDDPKLEESALLISKFIDNSTTHRKPRNNGRRIDYATMDRELLNQRLGNRNNNGGRRF